MSKKIKQFVWHKRRGKFIPSKFLKPQEKTQKDWPTEEKLVRHNDKVKDFFEKLSQEIRKAL